MDNSPSDRDGSILMLAVNGTQAVRADGEEVEEDDRWSLDATQTALSCAVVLSLLAVSLLANAGVIWYERAVVPDARRTLLNQLAVLASAYQLGATATSFPLVAVRLLLGGGLAGPACHLQNFLHVWSTTQIMLCYNELVLLHYVYVCRLGTVGVIKEELVLRLVVWTNLVLGLFVALAHGMALHTRGHVYPRLLHEHEDNCQW